MTVVVIEGTGTELLFVSTPYSLIWEYSLVGESIDCSVPSSDWSTNGLKHWMSKIFVRHAAGTDMQIEIHWFTNPDVKHCLHYSRKRSRCEWKLLTFLQLYYKTIIRENFGSLCCRHAAYSIAKKLQWLVEVHDQKWFILWGFSLHITKQSRQFITNLHWRPYVVPEKYPPMR